jgi:hypothetical protein
LSKQLLFQKSIAFRAPSALALFFLFAFVLLAPAGLRAQAPAKPAAKPAAQPAPDTVVFMNGEKLVGYFEGLTGGAAKFKSNDIGEVTLDLSKIQELQTSVRFAVIRKGVKLAKNETDGQIPRGTISITNKTVVITPGDGKPVQNVPVSDLGDIVDEATFLGAFQRVSILHDWKGALSVGASLVEATQDSTSLSTAVNLVRIVPLPTQNWLPARDRTLLAFSDSYGEVTQPDTPTVKTSIFHAAAERDQYFDMHVYAFGSVTFDHNFSQDLDLQQIYGGGVGWSAIKKAKETLDLKGSVNYERQSFAAPAVGHNLVDSAFAEIYTRTVAHGVAFNEQISVSPAWTLERAYSAYGSLGIIVPVYKRFAFNANAIDSFLNDPPAGFKKNSVQFTTGITYTIS